MEFLNFQEISKSIPFTNLLDALNIPYTQKNGELHGDVFIINIGKNLFMSPKNPDLKGSVINFYSHFKNVDLRTAASELKKQFLSEEKKPKRDMPVLTLDWNPYLQERGISIEVAKEYEVGLVKQRSVMAGRITFKIYTNGIHSGYIGYKVEDGTWFYPKGFKRPLYNHHRVQGSYVIVTTDPFDALRLVTLGLKQVTSLLGNSMTEEQALKLQDFKFILLLHKDPVNIINRMYPHCFIKAPVLSKPLKEYSDEEIQSLIKHT